MSDSSRASTAAGRVNGARHKLLAMGLEFVPNTPEQAAARMRREADKWALVVDRLGLRAD